jgi:hypothetical protein
MGCLVFGASRRKRSEKKTVSAPTDRASIFIGRDHPDMHPVQERTDADEIAPAWFFVIAPSQIP